MTSKNFSKINQGWQSNYILFFGVKKRNFLFLVLFMILFWAFNSFSVYSEDKPKFLIIHLDAVSSPKFFQYMKEGYFPNIRTIFEEGGGHIIPYGLSLFPGGTETAIPHLREGVDNSTGGVGWGYYDREKNRIIKDYVTLFDMLSYIPRRAKASFFYGIPFLDFFNIFPLMNIPELLETYNIIQFFWLTTDPLGHYFGEDLYISSLKRFDHYLGKLIKNLDLDKVNIIIYCDHGMYFGQFINSPQREEIKRIIGEDLIVYIHPNIYLKNPEEKDFWAKKIILESEIDLTFYQQDEKCIIGYTKYGKIIFKRNDQNEISYLYEGQDIFEYYTNGYQREWLDASQWLLVTKKSNFPGVPPNIFNLFMNEKSGDIIIVINPPKIPIFNLRYPANHAGLTKYDLLVPILLRGKELEHLYEIEDLWLHELFNKIPTLDLANSHPNREKHHFSFWSNFQEGVYPGFEVSLSPAYRWNIVLQQEQEIYKGWLEYDFYSSYVLRFWAGAGLQYQNNNLEPFLNARLQMDFGKIQFNYGGQANFHNLRDWRENRKEISYQLNDYLSLNWRIPERIGISFCW